jgi:hypothetical protein
VTNRNGKKPYQDQENPPWTKVSGGFLCTLRPSIRIWR